MEFDPCPQKIVNVVLKAGAVIRQIKGLPEEKNITVLYNETVRLLGISGIQMNSRIADHLPSPGEIRDGKGRFVVPRKECPRCGNSMVLGPICQSCKDAEGGKYKSGYKCEACQFTDDKSDKFFTERLAELGIEVPTGLKQDIGIQTITDTGLE